MSLTCLREASEVDDMLQERDDLAVEAAVMRGAFTSAPAKEGK